MSSELINPLKPAVLLEICIDSCESALNAVIGGCNRLELCSALIEGGLTPSYGLIKQCRKLINNIPIHVLIRPRSGDFHYNENELSIIIEDIKMVKELNCAGIVIGILNTDSTINMNAMQQIIDIALPLQITFHRAFDMIQQPFNALDQLMQLNQNNYVKNNNTPVIQRILTSGQCNTAIQGGNNIKSYIEYLKHKNSDIIVMAGGGINEDNVTELAINTGCIEVHGSCRSIVESDMKYKQLNVFMGSEKGNNNHTEYTTKQTNKDKVMKIVQSLANIAPNKQNINCNTNTTSNSN